MTHLSNIFLTEPEQPAQRGSMVIDQGLILPKTSDCQHDREIDGAGGYVVPGMIDSHLHLVYGAESQLQLDLSKVRSREAFEQAIFERHQTLPAERWLIASGWNETQWEDHVLPDLSWLRAAGHRPVICHRADLHAMVVNDAVLQRAGIDRQRRDPDGGRIVRWTTGANSGLPTGLLVEAAAWHLVNPIIPTVSVQARQQALAVAQGQLNAQGLTAVRSMEYRREVEEVLMPMRDQLTLRTRVVLLDRDWPLDVSFAEAFEDSDMLAMAGHKAFVDGTMGSGTARLHAPYNDANDSVGQWVEMATDDTFEKWGGFLAEKGLTPVMHVIGDAALTRAIDMVEAHQWALSPTFEHAQQIQPEDVARLSGQFVSMQPEHRRSDAPALLQKLGAARIKQSFPLRSLVQNGAVLAFGSDWPVVSSDPWLGMAAAMVCPAIEGFDKHQCLTLEESWRAYTQDAARVCGFTQSGTLKPGNVADLVIIDRDPRAIDWTCERPKVLLTMVGGHVVYDAR